MKHLFYICLILLIAACEQSTEQMAKSAIMEVMPGATSGHYDYVGYRNIDTVSYIEGSRLWFTILHQYTIDARPDSIELELIVFPGEQAFVYLPGEATIPYPAEYLSAELPTP